MAFAADASEKDRLNTKKVSVTLRTPSPVLQRDIIV